MHWRYIKLGYKVTWIVLLVYGHYNFLIEDIEKVKKTVQSFKNMSYTERHTRNAYRRIREAMIEVIKILNGKYYKQVTRSLEMSQNMRTRGNTLKLETSRSRYDIEGNTSLLKELLVFGTVC